MRAVREKLPASCRHVTDGVIYARQTDRRAAVAGAHVLGWRDDASAEAYRGDSATPGVTYTITASIGTASPSQVTPTSGDFGFAVQLPVDVVPGQVVHIVVAPPPGSDLPAATLDEATRGPILRDLDSYNRPAGIGDPL